MESARDVVQDLESYANWELVRERRAEIYSEVPDELNTLSKDDLYAQIHYVDAIEQNNRYTTLLQREVAELPDDVLSLTQKIGVIAAFGLLGGSKTHKSSDSPSDQLSGVLKAHMDLRHITRRGRGENTVNVSHSPLGRAEQITEELDRLNSVFDSKKPVDILLIWNNHFNGTRMDYDEVVLGSISSPREVFKLDESCIKTSDDSVSVDVPLRISGIEKKQVIRQVQYVQPEGKYQTAPLIELSRLLGHKRTHDIGPDGVYIGKDRIEPRLEKAKADIRAYDQQIEWSRKRRALDMSRRRRRFGR